MLHRGIIFTAHIHLQRWYIDGTVKCFTGGHLPLAIVAVLVLIFCVLIMVFVTAVVMEKIKVCMCVLVLLLMVAYLLQKHWAFSMARLLKVPFTEDHRWWATVELLKRIIFVILIIVLPGNLVSICVCKSCSIQSFNSFL